MSAEQLQAGAGIVTITPPLGTLLAGLFHERPAETVDDDLRVRALVLDDGTARTALVVCDLIYFHEGLVAAVRERIAGQFGIPPTNVMISGTHTHTGPIIMGHRSQQPDAAYVAWLPGRIADAVGIAVSRLQPARIASGAADTQGVCFNRRYRMRNGTVIFNPGRNNPDVIKPAGPIDPQVVAMLVEDLDGTPIALWACLSLHYVGTDNELAISPDYFGKFARQVACTLGDGCVGLLANGTSGNINNVDIHGTVANSGDARSRMVAATVCATAVSAVVAQPRRRDLMISANAARVPVQRWPLSDDDLRAAEALLDASDDAEPAPFSGLSFISGQPIPGWQAPVYARSVQGIAALPAEQTVEIQAIQIGEVVIASMPGEIFVEFGLQIKATRRTAVTAVVSMANGHIGYLPTTRAFDEGGYETWRTTVSWTAKGTGEALTTGVLDLIGRL